MDHPHPFRSILGSIDYTPLEGGRQSYISWGESQPDIMMTIGEICRQHLNIAVFLGAESGFDYFMHLMGAELPDDAMGFDFDGNELEFGSEAGWSDRPVQKYGHHAHVHC